MKTKIAGIVVLLLVVLAGGGYYIYSENMKVTTLNGYLGGEKIGLFEDEEIQSILKKKYQVEFEYSRAGSLDMVTADQTGRDYLFPSSQTALEYYQDTYGKTASDEIIFNTPLVLYSHKIVADVLEQKGVVSQKDGVYYADMKKLVELIESDTKWSDLGLTQLYGNVSVDTTDPVKSNSGNMFAALVACAINNENSVETASVDTVLPRLKGIFEKLGYMETSSSDLFNQFLRMGVGAKPIIAGYESQLLEYAAEKPDEYARIRDDVVIIYPTPTIWSTHIYIALDDDGKKGIEALLDEKIQKLAWEKHGFRTSGYDISSEGGEGKVTGVCEEVISVMNMPEYDAMRKIMEGLE
ncbi:MAG: hypothetical protein PUC12_03355 [Clostridiales bacterium]|nr:hypothetical protein [Clostridiales bacterium]